ncbi:MAG: YciI family protein [Dehalococcoidia bacterium]
MKSFVVRKFFSPEYREMRLASGGEAGSPMNTPEMEAIRQAHLDYLGKLKAEGKLFCGGPLTDWTWAMDIYRADSEKEVERLLDGDPFAQSGIFSSREIKEWRQAF